jgi:pyruvate kinase
VGRVRRTKIVATIGPASREPEVLRRLMDAGMDVARLNFAHGDHAQHAETVERIRAAADSVGRPLAILQDLPGPKLRIGPLRDDVVELGTGDHLTLTASEDGAEPGDAHRMNVSWPGLAEAIASDEVLYLADGSIRLRTEAVRPDAGEIDTVVEVGGAVASRQGLNVPGELAELPTVPEEDLQGLSFGESIGVDLVALSFVRRPEDVSEVRQHTRMPLVAKIEKPQAVDALEEIIRAADCVMVARGDLGIELPIEEPARTRGRASPPPRCSTR